ncbi:hypothetical protein PsalN5692_03629 (plasmid) [Piscirickettsia salmonis]|uniref:hypothetical protein n=1 Tax=Piscirickettsia salmonis TaxID=1238 RepID=UPI0012B773BE|nr:hypothetical protein [Piscirickettsia salmonis]QGP52121.1 hypothetical protein PsalN5692_03629 [Piscirickettsia salmonis]
MASKKKQIANLLAPNKTIRRSSNPVYAKLPDENKDESEKYGIKQTNLSEGVSGELSSPLLTETKRGNKGVTKSTGVAETKRGNKGVTKSPGVTEAKRGNKGVTKSPGVTEAKRGNKGVTKPSGVAEAKKGNKETTKPSGVAETKKGNKGVTNLLDDETVGHSPLVVRSKTGLIGLEYRIVLALCDRCKEENYITGALKINEIAITLGSNRATIKQSLLRLRRKGVIKVFEHKNGRGGWTKFLIEESIFRSLKESA